MKLKSYLLTLIMTIFCVMQTMAAFVPQSGKRYFIQTSSGTYIQSQASGTRNPGAKFVTGEGTAFKITEVTGGFTIQNAANNAYLLYATNNNWDTKMSADANEANWGSVWTITENGDGTYKISPSTRSTYYLGNGNTNNGTGVFSGQTVPVPYTIVDAFEPVAEKKYYLYSPVAKAYFNLTSVDNASAASYQKSGTALVIVKKENGKYTLKDAYSGKYIAAPTTQAWKVSTQDAEFEWSLDGTVINGNTYYYVAKSNAYALVNDGNCNDKALLSTQGSKSKNNAHWQLITTDDVNYMQAIPTVSTIYGEGWHTFQGNDGKFLISEEVNGTKILKFTSEAPTGENYAPYCWLPEGNDATGYVLRNLAYETGTGGEETPESERYYVNYPSNPTASSEITMTQTPSRFFFVNNQFQLADNRSLYLTSNNDNIVITGTNWNVDASKITPDAANAYTIIAVDNNSNNVSRGGVIFKGNNLTTDIKFYKPESAGPSDFTPIAVSGYTFADNCISIDNVNRTITVTYALASASESENPTSVAAMLERIGGTGASKLISSEQDAELSENNKEVFIITSKNGRPHVKGSTLSAITAGIGYYLNHYAKVNLTWNNLTCNLSEANLPVPSFADKHVCTADYRYYLNYCTYSYSMSVWDEARWMKEIDWMALHGVNMPLAIVGMEAVWKKLLTDSDANKRITASADANALNSFVPGPSYQAWWLMGNLQGMGGPNPDWWYTHQEALGKKIVDRMRELGMEPVLPGFAGQVPTAASGLDAVGNGSWCSFTAPALVKPGTDNGTPDSERTNFNNIASKYYNALHSVFGESKYYSMDLFHETGAAPSGINAENMFKAVEANLPTGSKWLIQQWQWSGTQGNSCSWVDENKLVVLDLWSEVKQGWKNTYGGGKNFNGREMIYCMLHNFGGRTGIYGRLSQTINGYYEALNTSGLKTKGVGATPEGIETNPILYDALYELPWTTISNVDTWVTNWVESRYGADNDAAKEAWALLTSEGGILNCPTQQQGVSEPIICARPALEIPSASAWSTSKIYYDTQKVIKAADLLKSATSSLTGKNYSYDLTDVVRQIMTDQAQPLLAEIKKAYEAESAKATKNWAKYDALVTRYTTLIEDIDRLLSTNEDFMLGRWTSMARNNAGSGTAPSWSNPNYADAGYNAGFSTGADWTEWNARKLITTWGYTAQCNRGRLRDYSQREWAGLLKDFYLPRWSKYFTQLKSGNNIGREDAGWYADEDEWCRKYTTQYSAIPVGETATVAAELFPKYFGKFAAASGEYYINLGFPSTVAEVMDNAFRGETYTPSIVSTPSISKIAIDLNGDGTISASETANATSIAIPAGAKSGKALAIITMTDGTEFTFTALIKDNVTVARTVAVVKPTAAEQGTVTIDGGEDNEHNPVAVTDADGKLSVTTTNDVTITAVPSQAYDFVKWTKDAVDFSTQNPFIYTEKPGFELTPVFAQNKWANVPEDKKEYGTVQSYSQYASTISFMPNADEATEIYQTATCPVNLYNVVPTVVNAAKGSAFSLNWTGKGLNYTRLSAYVDLNGDGDFADEGEFVGTIGDLSKQNAELNNGSIQIVLPYDATVGLTHVRLRFDGAWETGNMTAQGGREPYQTTTRMVYDIKLNITEYSTAPTATVTAVSADPALGAVRITGGQIDNQNPAIVNEGKEVTLDATPATGYKFQQWVDEFERVVSTEAHYVFRPIGNMTYRAEFIAADDDYFYKGAGNVYTFEVKDVCKLQSLRKDKVWTIHMDIESSDATYNEYGSSALAAGTNPLESTISGFQIYLTKNGTVKVNGAESTISATKNFTLDLRFDGNNQFYGHFIGKATDGTDKEVGASNDWHFTKSLSADITQLSCALPVGINIKTLTIEANYDDSEFVTAPTQGQTTPYVTGNGKVQLMHAMNYITNKDALGNVKYTKVPEGKAWQMVMDVVHEGNQTASYNKWGSCILASEADPINTFYWNNFQIYEHSGTDGSKRGTLNFKSNKGDGNDHVIAQGHKVFQNETNGYEDYRVIVRYDGGNVYLIRTIILDAEGNPTDQIFNNVWFAARVQHDIDVMSTALPTGTNIKTLEISIAEESNLMEDVEYAIQNERTSEYLSCHYLNGPDEHYLGADRASKFMIEFTNNRDLAFHDGDGGLHPTIYIKAEVYNEDSHEIEWKYIGADNRPVADKANAIPFLYSDNSKMIEPISNMGMGDNVTSTKDVAWSIADFNRWNFVFFGNYLVKITKSNIDVNTEVFGGITYKRNPFRNNEYVSLPTNAQQYQMPNTSEVGYSATITKDGTMLRVNYTPLEDTFYNITDLDLFGTGTTLYYWNKEQNKLITYSTTNSQSGVLTGWNTEVVNGLPTSNLFGDCSKFTIAKATKIPMKMSAVGGKYYNTVYCPNALTLPDGVKAYRLNEVADSKFKLKEIELTNNVLPAKTAAVLISESVSGESDWTISTTSPAAIEGTNLFSGVFEKTANSGFGQGTNSNVFVLGNKSGIGFFPYTAAQIPAFKVYYEAPASSAKGFLFSFEDDEETTGITENAADASQSGKTIVYDLMGRRVQTLNPRQIYIINGKKIVAP